MSSYNPYDFFVSGPFAETQQKMEDFGNNIVLSHYFEETAKQQQIIEKEYWEAVLNGDTELAKEKQHELTLCEGAIQLTAGLFDPEMAIS